MHPRTRYRACALASATVIALLAAPGLAVAVPDPELHQGSHSGNVAVLGEQVAKAAPGAIDPADKITPAATRAFRTTGATDFWLRFADETDLTPARSITDWDERGEYVHDTLVAAAGVSQEQAIAELEESGTAYTSYWATNAILVEGGSLDLATDLAADSEVLEVRPAARYDAPAPVPADAAADAAAADTVSPSAVTPAWGVSAINADDLWDAGFTGEGMVVANIDTGVDGAHPALSGKYRGNVTSELAAYSFFSVDSQRTPHDSDGHGTHTMGTMVGGTVRSGGADRAVGVAPDAQWIAAAGGAEEWADSDLVASGQWILAPYRQGTSNPAPDPTLRPHVVNNSWGADFSTDPFMEDLITAWEAAGIFSTFANGNQGEAGCQSSGSPASRTVNYSVGAFTQSGTIAPFSARGPGQSGSVKPDIAAPGVNILSTVLSGGSAALDGTSMAAPHVAGAVALLWSAVPELVGNVPATRAVLDGSAHDMNDVTCGGTTGDNNVWGEGKLDVLAAYTLAQGQAFDTTTVPTVSGAEYRVGKQLTSSTGAWSPAATFTYQWRRAGRMIPGATKATYTLQGADLGQRLSVTVLGSADGRTPTATTSAETPTVSLGALTASTPKISGTVRVGSTLRALSGSWTSGTRFTYQWYANGATIKGATGFSYTPTHGVRGKQLKVRVVGTRAGYGSASRSSATSKAVATGTFSQHAPIIIGVAASGTTLKLSRPQSTPVPGSIAYRWKLDGRAISGATGSSLAVRSAWKGKKITVSATVRRTGYTTRTVTSAAAKVGTKYAKSPNPTITGTVRVGSSLRAVPGTWSPKPSFSYQWYAQGLPISGATKSTYRLTGADYKKQITVSVRTYRSGYGTSLRRSSSTRAVLTPALKFPGDDGTAWYVGPDSVPAGNYVAQAGTADCYWERYDSSGRLASRDAGSGQRIVKVQSSDSLFWSSSSCGTWTKYYSGMVTTRASTAGDGVYAIGDHLERGVYSTAGPSSTSSPCYYAFYKGFYGHDGVVAEGEVSQAHTVTMPSGASGFETAGCSWRRIG